MVVKYPCRVCSKPVCKNHKAMQCDMCNKWVHMKCNLIDNKTYQKLQDYKHDWYCIDCTSDILPFSKVETPIRNSGRYLSHKELEIIEELNNAIDQPDSFSTCKYFTPEEMQTIDLSNQLSVFHLNISSLSYHFDEFNTFLNSNKLKPTIIGITETRIKKGQDPLNDISLPNYNIEHTSTEGPNGGALLYLDKTINYTTRDDLLLYKTKELESIFVEIIQPKGKNLIVGCIYRHPHMEITEFNEHFLTKLISNLKKEKKDVLLLGDFNIDLLKYDSQVAVASFLDKMYANAMIPYITGPTRITVKTQSLIDNIFTSLVAENTISGNITTTFSDHFCQFISLQIPYKIKTTRKETYARNFRHFDKIAFSEDIKNHNWLETLQIIKNDVNLSMKIFEDTVNTLLDTHVPIKKLSNQDLLQKSKPWITKGLVKSIKVKNVMYRKMMRARDPIRKENLHKNFKDYKNRLTKLSRLSKANHYNNFFIENKNNLLKTWEGVKAIINSKKKTRQDINSIKHDGKILTDKKQISEVLNNYFTTIPKEIEEKVVKPKTNFNSYLQNPTLNSFFMTPTTSEEIENKIASLRNNKANGPASIPTKVLKECKHELSKPLEIIINLSFTNGVFPDSLKTSNVKPIFKSGDKSKCTNYRPIALLSNISKIIEKLVHDRIYSFLEKENILYTHQYGFRLNRSTTHTLIYTTETIREACDNDKYACAIYLDLKKAFDTVNHKILLEKLRHYGVRGIANNWFRTFLTGRTQYTTINDSESSILNILFGVPQGSVLGPLLFVLYINDLHNAVKHSLTFHYADDTNLLLISESLKQINSYVNHDLSLITEWLRANRISLNTSKTEIVIFKPNNKEIKKHLNFRVSGQLIKATDKVKYLGLIFQENLRWDIHMKQLITKLQRAIGLLSKVRHYVPRWLLRTIYYSLFNSHLVYACEVWGQKNTVLYQKILNLQNKAIKIINFDRNNKNIRELYKENKILCISDFIVLKNALLVKDCLEGINPTGFHNYFVKAKDLHQHNTRSATKNLVDIPQVKTTYYGHFSIRSQSALNWNHLQNSLEINLLNVTRNETKKIITKKLLEA